MEEDKKNVIMEENKTNSDLSLNYENMYNNLTKEYQKLVLAFNRLLDEYNQLHIRLLLTPEEEQSNK